MNPQKLLLILVLLLSLPAMACGFLSSDATATPIPTAAVIATSPPATSAPEATATTLPTEPPPTEAPPTEIPEPTDTPEPEVTANLVSYESETAGLTVEYPADWAVLDFVFLIIASDDALLDDPSGFEEGALMVMITSDASEAPEGTAAEILEVSVSDFELEDVEVIEEPTATEIQGQDAAIARISGTADDGTALDGIAAVILNDDRVAVIMGVSPEGSSADFLPTIEAIINTVQVSQPTADDITLDSPFDLGQEPAGELVLLAPGDVFSHGIPDDTYQEYSFEGFSGESAVILVDPDEDFDAVLEIYPAGDSDTLLEEVDDGFSGEPEVVEFIPDEDGEYILRVRPFGFTGGEYVLHMLDQDEGLTITGTVPEDDVANVRVCVPAGEPLIVIVLPEDEFDLVLNLFGPEGETLIDFELDNGLSGDPEIFVYVEGADLSDGPYAVIVEVGGWAGAGGDFTLLLGPAGVTEDGC